MQWYYVYYGVTLYNRRPFYHISNISKGHPSKFSL